MKKVLSYVGSLPMLAGFFIISCLAIAGTGTSDTAEALPLGRCHSVQTMSHRGRADRAHTENTYSAFAYAIATGSRGVEGDLQLTKDGQWVLMHDNNVSRTTRNSGTISGRTLAQVQQIVTNSGRRDVPTIQQIGALLAAHPRVELQLEIKATWASAQRMKELQAVLTKYNLKNRVVVSSFNAAALNRFRSVDRTWKTGLITSRAISAATAKRYGNNIIINYRKASPRLIASMHRSGIKVYVWTVNSKSAWKKSVRSGADVILSDYVPRIRSYCR